MKAKFGENNQFLRAVVTSLWSEFAEPWFAELANPDGEIRASKEARMFMQELLHREPVNGYAKAQTRISLNLESKHKQAQCAIDLN